MAGGIHRQDNRIIVLGGLFDFHRVIAMLHSAIEKLRYQDIVLDFSGCTEAFPPSMISICARIIAYRDAGVDFELVPPEDAKLKRLFTNAGWGYHIDPTNFTPSNFKGYTSVPAIQYRTPAEQQAAVNQIMDVMLGAIPEIEREDMAAFEWSVNELTDNVLVHSRSNHGGLVQVSTFKKFRKRIQFIVADVGIGIPTSLRSGQLSIKSDIDALDMAIREGVTRDTAVGQGNGLFGSYEICSKSGGEFFVDSGYARLKFHDQTGLRITDQAVPYNGTLVVSTIDFSNPMLLADALRFKGVKHAPTDIVEIKYVSSSAGDIHFVLKDECASFGSRVSGKPVRIKLLNLSKMSGKAAVHIDFAGVPIVSSSFADEAFGKLCLLIGPPKFKQKIKFSNMMGSVEALVNKAITQRMEVGLSDADR